MGYAGIAKEKFEERIFKIRRWIMEESLDGFFIYNEEFRPGHSLYISDYMPVQNIEFSPSVVYIDQENVMLFLGEMNARMAKGVTHIEDIRCIESIDVFLEEKRGQTFGLCGVEKLPGLYRKHLEAMGVLVNFKDCELFFANLRLYKDEEEMEKIITAAFYANHIMKEVSGDIKEGVTTEREIASKAEYLIKTKGLEIGYDTIVSEGLNTRENTHRPNNDRIHEVVTINIVPRYKGYSSFYTITKGISNLEAQKVCECSKQVIAYMLDNLRVGDSTERIFELYQEKTGEFGLLPHLLPLYNKEEFVGCSTGLDPVEYPYLRKGSHLILKKGMVLSLKYYLAGFSWGDIKFEFNVLLDDKPILLNDIYMD